MSSKKLTNPQYAVLENGFNFAITQKFVTKLDIINGVEAGIRKVRDEAEVQIARSKVSKILKSAKPPQRNITHEEEALKELKKDENIVILKADKGNATVVMNATEYNDNINCLLSDSSIYRKLSKKSNPITKITSDVNKYVWNRFKNQKITKAEYHFLHCSKVVIPRFYGLPKVHRVVSVPLRFTVSFINSPTYNLSKYLSRILFSLSVNRYSVCNSKKFVDYVKNFTISENEILVSFDVVSLFTSVPVDKVLGLVLDLLSSDESLASRTSDILDITIGL